MISFISLFIRGQVVKRHKCTTGTSVYRRLFLAHKRNLRGSVRIRLLIRPSGFSWDCLIVRGVLADFQTPVCPHIVTWTCSCIADDPALFRARRRGRRARRAPGLRRVGQLGLYRGGRGVCIAGAQRVGGSMRQFRGQSMWQTGRLAEARLAD